MSHGPPVSHMCAAAQQCLSKSSTNCFLSFRERKNLQCEGNSYATRKRSAAVVKKLTSKTNKANRSCFRTLLALCTSGFPRKTHPIHCPNCFTSRPNDKKTFPLNHSLACANYAIYAAIHACMVYVNKAEK